MAGKLRTFIAVPIPADILTRIREVQEAFAAYKFPVRWVRPESIHLTLKFLGEIAEADLERVYDAMAASLQIVRPLSLHAKGVGVFPTVKRPKVLWVGIGGELESLKKIQAELENNLEKIGFPKEKRPFNAHLTLGRVKGKIDSRKLAGAMREFSDFTTESFSAEEIVLFKSDLKPSGAVYTRLRTASLTESTDKSTDV